MKSSIFSTFLLKLEEQLKRAPKTFPTLNFKRKVENIDDFTMEDFQLNDYKPHGKIAMKMAVWKRGPKRSKSSMKSGFRTRTTRRAKPLKTADYWQKQTCSDRSSPGFFAQRWLDWLKMSRWMQQIEPLHLCLLQVFFSLMFFQTAIYKRTIATPILMFNWNIFVSI